MPVVPFPSLTALPTLVHFALLNLAFVLIVALTRYGSHTLITTVRPSRYVYVTSVH